MLYRRLNTALSNWTDLIWLLFAHIFNTGVCVLKLPWCVWLSFNPVSDMVFTFPLPIAFLYSWCVVGLCMLLFPLAAHWSVCSECPLSREIGLASVTVVSSYLLPILMGMNGHVCRERWTLCPTTWQGNKVRSNTTCKSNPTHWGQAKCVLKSWRFILLSCAVNCVDVLTCSPNWVPFKL